MVSVSGTQSWPSWHNIDRSEYAHLLHNPVRICICLEVCNITCSSGKSKVKSTVRSSIMSMWHTLNIVIRRVWLIECDMNEVRHAPNGFDPHSVHRHCLHLPLSHYLRVDRENASHSSSAQYVFPPVLPERNPNESSSSSPSLVTHIPRRMFTWFDFSQEATRPTCVAFSSLERVILFTHIMSREDVSPPRGHEWECRVLLLIAILSPSSLICCNIFPNWKCPKIHTHHSHRTDLRPTAPPSCVHNQPSLVPMKFHSLLLSFSLTLFFPLLPNSSPDDEDIDTKTQVFDSWQYPSWRQRENTAYRPWRKRCINVKKKISTMLVIENLWSIE